MFDRIETHPEPDMITIRVRIRSRFGPQKRKKEKKNVMECAMLRIWCLSQPCLALYEDD